MEILKPVIVDMNNQNFTEALKKLNKIIKKNKGLNIEFALKGDILFKLNDYENAKKNFLTGVKKNKLPERCLLGLGLIEERLSNYNMAYKYYIESIKKLPTAEAFNQLGLIFYHGLGKVKDYKEAMKFYNKGIELNKKFYECSYNKGTLEHEIGEYKKAIKSFIYPLMTDESNLKLNYNDNAYINLINKILRSINEIAREENSLDKMHKAILFHTLQIIDTKDKKNKFINTHYLKNPIQILLRETIKEIIKIGFTNNLLDKVTNLHSTDARKKINLDNCEPKEVLYNKNFIQLINNPIITIGLKLFRNTQLIPEFFFISLRKLILFESLNNPDKLINESGLDPIIKMITKQCFENEYIWEITKEENLAIGQLYSSVTKKYKSGESVSNCEIQILASYKKLYDYSNIKNFLKKIKKTESIYNLIKLQVLDYEEEADLLSRITSIGKINNKISLNVQSQYEENPYPRWLKEEIISKSRKNKIINNLSRVEREIYPNRINDKKKEIKNILIAGCGTGSHPVSVALSEPEVKVYALDISKASIAYGMRQAKELNISNIEWLHGDILEFDSFNKEFDIIESSGVLHHTENPNKGFQTLTKKLSKGGFFKVGLYSKSYRQLLNPAKKMICECEFKSNKDNEQVREARKKLIELIPGNRPELIPITTRDFYSTSEFIDLLMHAQELSYEMEDLINLYSKDYNFLGFIFSGNTEKNQYRDKFPVDEKMIDLNNWSILEKDNTMLFNAMYQFWLQKK